MAFPTIAIISFACFVILCWLTYARSRHIAALLIPALLYLYTFHGFLISLLTNAGMLRDVDTMFLGGAPYDVSINDQFWLALVMQGVFADVYMLVLCSLVRPTASNREVREPDVVYRPMPLVIAGAVALGVGGLMWLQALTQAMASQQSLYLFFKEGGDLGVWYPVSRVLFDVASMSTGAAIGIILPRLGEPEERRARLLALSGALGVAATLALIMGLLGDRATLFGGIIFGMIVASRRRVRFGRLAAVGFVALLALNIITFVRDGAVLGDTSGSSLLAGAVNGVLVTAEASITFSMYAVVRFPVPTSHGMSVLFMLEALIPRFIRPERVTQDAFEYYANAVGLPPLRGWGMHFATDAYINFGILGLVIGAGILALLHGALLRQLRARPHFLFPFAGCLAAFPIGFRAGIPGLKTMAMGLVIGYCLAFLARPKSELLPRWTALALRRPPEAPSSA